MGCEEKKMCEVSIYGEPGAETLLIQPVDGHDLEWMEQEIEQIRERTGGQRFCLKAFRVENWNRDLSPWPAPAVFGREDFGDGAAETLKAILRECAAGDPPEAAQPKRVFLGGYSLAGLFALWAGCRTERFDGIAAASPSVWFPRFTDYLREEKMRADRVYLSLGDREEKTRNPVMAQVGKAIRETEAILKENGTDCVLEWNSGNHFKEADLRTAKAFAWLMNR